jgi:hypothetical protein
MGHTKHAVMVGHYVTYYRKSVLEGGGNCTHAGMFKNEFAPMQVLMEKNPALQCGAELSCFRFLLREILHKFVLQRLVLTA